MKLTVITEEVVRGIATRELAFDAVSRAFESVAAGRAEILPVVLAQGGPPGSGFGVKSAADLTGGLIGLKVGSYWPGNRERGLPNHGSTTMLLDPETGLPDSLISAGYLNGLRTAAANAVAVDRLARPDAAVLGVIGAGHQAEFEVRAVADKRPIERVKIWSRTETTAADLCRRLSDLPAEVAVSSRREAVTGSDILTTVTPSTEPLVEAAWISPGTHISAMGADTQGKQELEAAIARAATCFADKPEQAVRIGELQHAFDDPSSIVSIGAVLLGQHPGRQSEEEITLFDSSGIAIQDLYVAEAVVRRARDESAALSVDF